LLVLHGACTQPGSTNPASKKIDAPSITQADRNTTAMWGFDPAVDASWAVAQSFTVPEAGLSIAGLTMWVETASGEGFTVEIHELLSEEQPFGTRLHTVQVDPLQIQPNREWRIEITPPLPAKPKTAYSFVVLPQGRSSIQLGLKNTNPYFGGRGFSFDPHPDRGWKAEDFDLTFTIELTSEA